MRTRTTEITHHQEAIDQVDSSDKAFYQNAFFGERGGDTLEVALLWGDHVLSVNTYAKRNLTIGNDANSDIVLDGIDFELVSYDDVSGYTVQFDARMSGVFQTRGQMMPLSEAVENGTAVSIGRLYGLPLDSQTSVRVDLDDTTFLIHLTDIPLPVGNKIAVDKTPVPYIGLSGLGHLLMLFLAMMVPDSARAMNLDMFEAEDRFVQIALDPIEEIPEPAEAEGVNPSASRHEGDEGVAGTKDSMKTNKKLAVKGEAEDIRLKRARDQQIATSSGIATQLAISSPFSTNEESIGSDVTHAIGNLAGEEKGDSAGLGGLGIKGTGRSGGGKERGIGLDDMGTKKGTGVGKGTGPKGGSPLQSWDKDTKVPTKIVPGKVSLNGGLDRGIIQRVVRQHRRELKYCYESGLQQNRNLSGVVKIKFVISAAGSVMSARVISTTLKNKKVESCMTRKVRRWVFPEPKGGQITNVKYPFHLKR